MKATASSDIPANAAVPLGMEIRQLRRAKKLKLANLAERIDRSIGFVSQVERGLSSLSLKELGRIAAALDVPVSWFFRHESVPEEERGRVVRAGNRRSLGSAEDGLTEELLSPDLGGDFEAVLSSFEPDAELGEAMCRPTQELGYLVSGCLELWIGDKHFNLSAGDSFRVSGEPFRWRNGGQERAVVVWIISPPVY